MRRLFAAGRTAGINGICEGQASETVDLSEDREGYPAAIATALNKLRDGGVDGPFAVALSERLYTELTEITKAGYPVIDHVRRLVDGPIVWAPGLTGAVVLSMRGGDFELTVGQDFSIGYIDHTTERVRLYLEESFTFWLLSQQAAIPLAHRSGTAAAKGRTKAK